jgi:hypothetical protein
LETQSARACEPGRYWDLGAALVLRRGFSLRNSSYWNVATYALGLCDGNSDLDTKLARGPVQRSLRKGTESDNWNTDRHPDTGIPTQPKGETVFQASDRSYLDSVAVTEVVLHLATRKFHL